MSPYDVPVVDGFIGIAWYACNIDLKHSILTAMQGYGGFLLI